MLFHIPLTPVTQLSHTLEQIQQKLNELAPLVNRINNHLPVRDRLDPFILRPGPDQEAPDYSQMREEWSDQSSVSDDDQHRDEEVLNEDDNEAALP